MDPYPPHSCEGPKAREHCWNEQHPRVLSTKRAKSQRPFPIMTAKRQELMIRMMMEKQKTQVGTMNEVWIETKGLGVLTTRKCQMVQVRKTKNQRLEKSPREKQKFLTKQFWSRCDSACLSLCVCLCIGGVYVLGVIWTVYVCWICVHAVCKNFAAYIICPWLLTSQIVLCFFNVVCIAFCYSFDVWHMPGHAFMYSKALWYGQNGPRYGFRFMLIH